MTNIRVRSYTDGVGLCFSKDNIIMEIKLPANDARKLAERMKEAAEELINQSEQFKVRLD